MISDAEPRREDLRGSTDGTPLQAGSTPEFVRVVSPPGQELKSRRRKARSDARYVVLTGNPNSGKTTVFNALTGLRAKVGNYAGVTVERKEGRLVGAPHSLSARVLDLPGTYSLSPQSIDERISRDVLLNHLPELPPPALVVIVVDASNLLRNLYYATQVIELGHPTVVALNMMDVAEAHGHHINAKQLAAELGVEVFPVVASSGTGIGELRARLVSLLSTEVPLAEPRLFCEFPHPLKTEVERLAKILDSRGGGHRAEAEALLLLSHEKSLSPEANLHSNDTFVKVRQARERLEQAGVDWRGGAVESRYAAAARIQQMVTVEKDVPTETFSDRLDRVLTHKVWGTILFLLVMAALFQSIFTVARIPMDLLQSAVDWMGAQIGGALPPGDLNSLLVDGVIAGVGAVVVFLPQILFLFLFIGFLEDTGYMARAAFLMDRWMSKVGLHGKSFIPLLSSFACAIPGIMATRTIETPKDRLATIMIAPLMSCSARLPVYTLLIAACIPNLPVWGFLRLPGLVMMSMYLLGIFGALGMAWIFKKTLLKGETPMLILELPPYKRPLLRSVLRQMWDRSKLFLQRAGTIILAINILLWFFASYPRGSRIEKEFAAKRAAVEAATVQSAPLQAAEERTATLHALDQEEAGLKLQQSFAGRMGKLIEPVIEPLGFDWKIGIGLVMSFAAREVFVSTMSTVYSVAKTGSDSITGLATTFQEQRRADGTPMYTPLLGVTLMVFYVFALQCVSTVAIVRRETASWRWPIFQWLYMGVLAWGFAFLTWRVGHLLGFH